MLRFAPSTIYDMDVGSLRIALLNYIVAKQTNNDLLIRIEDIDSQSGKDGKDKEILEILNLFSIDYSRVSAQSENLKYYQKFAMQLLTQKKAFNCFCSDEALEKDNQKAKEENKPYSYSGFCENLSDDTVLNVNAPFRVRIKKPTNPIVVRDLLKGELSYTPLEVDSFVILNQNKSATYNFACAIDDMLFDISTVVRGENHLDDTPKQRYIRELLGYNKELEYIHIPIVKNHLSVKLLLDQGYLPIAIANYLVGLGYDTPKDIFTIEDAISWYDINKISKEPVEFDIKKLNYLNKEYLKSMDELRLSKILGYADKDIGLLAKIYLDESSTTKQIKEKIDAIFSTKETLDGFENEFKLLKECLEKAPFIDSFDNLKKHIIKETGLSDEKLSVPLRFILTGSTIGPELSEVYPLIKNYLGEIIC